jgi:hypothetical protein
MTLTEAIGILKSKLASNEFAASLARQFDQRGNLSSKQEYWAQKLAQEAENPAIPHNTETFDFAKISSLFTIASGHLKYPKVRLMIGDEEIVLSKAGTKSKWTGSINVTSLGSFDERSWYGRIGTDGQLIKSGKMTDQIVSVLRRFSADPAKVASEYGLLTGNCCFCRKQLTDKRSTEVGYGKVCAGHYSLPWG